MADNNWLSVGNWDGVNVPVTGDSLFFAGSTRLINTNNTVANTAYNGITFNSGAGTFVLWGNAINLGGGITNNSSSLQTVNLNLALTGTRTVDVTAGSTLSIGGIISGATFGITKNNTGTLVLSGNNSFTGVTTLNAGTLRATTSLNVLGTGAATLTLAGGTLELAHTANLNFARNTTVSGDTTIKADRTTASSTSITHTLGTLSIGGQTLTVQRGGNVTGAGVGGITFGAVTLTGAPVFDVASSALLTLGSVNNGANTLTVQGAGDTTITGIIGAGAGGLTKNGAGTLTLGAVNTYGGDTTISAGTLKLGVNSALPNGVGKGNVIVNGTLDLVSFTDIINGLSGSGTVTHGSGTDTLSVGDNDQTSTYSGVIQSTGGTLGLIKIGTGALTLNGSSANTYSGVTTVNAGTLVLGKSSGNAVGGDLTIGDSTGTDIVQLTGSNQIIDTSAVAINSTGILDLNGNSDTIGSLDMTAGSVTTGVGTLTLGGNVTGNNSASSATISGNLNLGGATRTFTIGGGPQLKT